jgi:hypothetical protein
VTVFWWYGALESLDPENICALEESTGTLEGKQKGITVIGARRVANQVLCKPSKWDFQRFSSIDQWDAVDIRLVSFWLGMDFPRCSTEAGGSQDDVQRG